MINPVGAALRRRSDELCIAAEREVVNDGDTAALLLFYAAECALKSVYMQRNGLKTTEDARGSAQSARSYGHRLPALVQALSISRSSVSRQPLVRTSRTGDVVDTAALHEAWRYGERLEGVSDVHAWLQTIITWCRNNR